MATKSHLVLWLIARQAMPIVSKIIHGDTLLPSYLQYVGGSFDKYIVGEFLSFMEGILFVKITRA